MGGMEVRGGGGQPLQDITNVDTKSQVKETGSQKSISPSQAKTNEQSGKIGGGTQSTESREPISANRKVSSQSEAKEANKALKEAKKRLFGDDTAVETTKEHNRLMKQGHDPKITELRQELSLMKEGLTEKEAKNMLFEIRSDFRAEVSKLMKETGLERKEAEKSLGGREQFLIKENKWNIETLQANNQMKADITESKQKLEEAKKKEHDASMELIDLEVHNDQGKPTKEINNKQSEVNSLKSDIKTLSENIRKLENKVAVNNEILKQRGMRE